jgi:hypothetical protein
MCVDPPTRTAPTGDGLPDVRGDVGADHFPRTEEVTKLLRQLFGVRAMRYPRR